MEILYHKLGTKVTPCRYVYYIHKPFIIQYIYGEFFQKKFVFDLFGIKEVITRRKLLWKP